MVLDTLFFSRYLGMIYTFISRYCPFQGIVHQIDIYLKVNKINSVFLLSAYAPGRSFFSVLVNIEVLKGFFYHENTLKKYSTEIIIRRVQIYGEGKIFCTGPTRAAKTSQKSQQKKDPFICTP
jgi:hypothetical protein